MAIIKDIIINDFASRLKEGAVTELRSYSQVSKLINLAAGLPELNPGEVERKQINRKANKLVYPGDLEGSKEYDTFIQFDVNELTHTTNPPKDKDDSSSSNSPITPKVGGLKESLSSITSSITSELTGAVSQLKNVFSDSSDTNTPPADITGKFSTNRRMSLCLYQPQVLSVSYDQQWSQEELGVAGAAVRGYRQGQGISALISGATSALEQATSRAIDSTAEKVGSGFGVNLRGALEKQRGSIVNPRLALLFKGTGFRTFQFSFVFSPRNQNEVIESLAIVKTFKYWSAPAYDVNRTFLTYPAYFYIRMMRKRGDNGSTENENLFEFKKAACTNVTVDYSPNAVWSTFSNGAPVSFKLDLSFVETELITRDAIYTAGSIDTGA